MSFHTNHPKAMLWQGPFPANKLTRLKRHQFSNKSLETVIMVFNYIHVLEHCQFMMEISHPCVNISSAFRFAFTKDNLWVTG